MCESATGYYSAGQSYLVIRPLLLLNVGHKRVHQAWHVSHFLSRPLIY